MKEGKAQQCQCRHKHTYCSDISDTEPADKAGAQQAGDHRPCRHDHGNDPGKPGRNQTNHPH